MSTLVLGIGNTLLTDEGVGVHATRYLSDHYTGFVDTRFSKFWAMAKYKRPSMRYGRLKRRQGQRLVSLRW